MYGKFFAQTFTGSMFGAGADVFAVWGYTIANTFDGHVELNPKLLAATIGSTEEAMTEAIEYLCREDPGSRSKDSNGARLVREGEYSYLVVNHQKFRDIGTQVQRREYLTRKKRESRARLRSTG